MTDRDLFYCGDFQCDGHARSNEQCCPSADACLGSCEFHTTETVFCDRVIGETHTASDHDACERRRINYLREKAAPKYTVSGNHLRMFRLDPDGNQTGEVWEVPGPLSFDIPEGTVSDATVFTDAQGFSNITLDIDMGQVDPALIALLTGQGAPPEEIEVMLLPHPWWVRAWRKVKGWVKGLNPYYTDLP